MASLYRKPCVDLALSDENYESDGLWNKYAERLDECDFFAGCGKKNGAVDYCAIAYCYWLFENVITDDGDINDNDRKYMVHYVMYQSDSCCTSAGCTQQANVYKDNSAFSKDYSELAVGHQIFFQKSNGQIYHTGICVDWNDSGFYTIEANVDSYHTRKRFYSYSDPKIAGFGIPRFDGYELISSNADPVIDNPEKIIPESFDNNICKFCKGITLTVKTVNDPLMLREGPSTDYRVIKEMPKGSKVTWYGYYTNEWYFIKYGDVFGFAHKDYLGK